MLILRRMFVVIPCLALCLGAATAHAQSSDAERAYLGLQLQSLPDPDLLATHLDLPPGQGVLVAQVLRASPAERAGLQRNDIIHSIDGRPAASPGDVVDYVQGQRVGDNVQLVVLQAGQRSNLTLTLAAAPARLGTALEVQPPRPASPFDRFTTPPFDRFESAPGGASAAQSLRFQYRSQVQTPEGSQRSEITIEGDPAATDTLITVTIDQHTYRTTVAEVDALPEPARSAAQEALAAMPSFNQSLRSPTGPTLFSPHFEELWREHQRWLQQWPQPTPRPNLAPAPQRKPTRS